MSDELTPTDYAFLILLQLAGGEISNTEMAKAHGVRLLRDNYGPLNAIGYIESDTKSRPYKHRLTSEGRKVLQGPLPVAAKAMPVWIALAALHASYLPVVPQDLERRIRSAYIELAAEPGAWVSLTRLRPLFGDVSKGDLDVALERLYDAPNVQLEPEANQKTLTPEDRRAAVRIGGEPRHLLAIGMR
ncbi:hypothetical protein [Dactylosporangium sp. NPDC051541]|uniref:hypothetical protein n=1 Tax=Dactylosporangium sp. NPDC051541 TaxID=3363977 RepID=UPI0037A7B79D